MTALIMKDLRIQRKFIVLGFFLIGFFFFLLGALEGIPLTVPALIYGHFLTVVASKLDEKNHNGLMLNSLPVTRRDIVTSKYVGMLIFLGLAFALTMFWRVLAGLLLPATELPWYSANTIVGSILIAAVFYSIYFPLFFAFGNRLAAFLDLIVIFAVVGVTVLTLRVLEWLQVDIGMGWLDWMTAGTITATSTGVGIALLLLAFSWWCSVRWYERISL
jgi:ABC-2 type transport system permease protein